MADAHYWNGMVLERDGDLEESDRAFARAVELDKERFRPPCRLSREEFDKTLQEAIALLPPYFRSFLDNTQIIVDDLPSLDLLLEFDPPMDPEVFGLFVGTPLVERSLMDTLPTAPDRIFVFRRNLERYCEGREQLLEEIRVTLLHEVGHAMGLDDEGLEKLGYA
jgi:predicted Zn-dependent protease with MMP-like domain